VLPSKETCHTFLIRLRLTMSLLAKALIFSIATEFLGTNAVAVSSMSITSQADGTLLRSEGHPDKKQADTKDKAKETGDAIKKVSSEATVAINLYYETKCPDCTEFITKILAPMWNNTDIRPHLNITMNPYGNAKSVPLGQISEGYKFFHPKTTGSGWEYAHICQHGSDECMGNLIQMCAEEELTKAKHMELIFCMAAKPSWSIEKASYECLQKVGGDPHKVKKCVDSPKGNKLFAEFGKRTGEVKGRLGTPWVMINGVNLVQVGDLLKTVCGHVGNGPKSCAAFKPKEEEKPAKEEAPVDDDTFTVLGKFKSKELVEIDAKNI